jgi:gamma-glutamyltranspeptidase/glutathione hydrolase
MRPVDRTSGCQQRRGMQTPGSKAPVRGRDVVATSQPTAVQAALEAFDAGGNAVDAAVAAAMALTVTEPTSNGIGSDAFAMVWDGDELHGLNASGRSPAAWTPERFAGREQMPDSGWESVTVPGAVSAWVALTERFGAQELATLAAPACRFARDGFEVQPWTAEAWAYAAGRFVGRDDFLAAFAPDGETPSAGARFSSPAHADTLERIAATKGEDFYRGELAERMAAHARAEGGALTLDDLAAHEVLWQEPLSVSWRGRELLEMPPNGQGLAALVALGVVERLDEATLDPNDAAGAHMMIEAMKVGIADAEKHVADPDHLAVKPEDLLHSKVLDMAAQSIDRERAWPPDAFPERDGGTVLIVTADREGRMVSLIQSNFMGFGSGVVVPDTGIALQNRGAGFSLKRGHANVVGPRKRPFHTILPAMVTKDGRPEVAFGVMGGPMQPQGHLQVLTRLVDEGLDPQAALDAPRWRCMGGRDLWHEPGFEAELLDGLARRGHALHEHPRRDVTFGGGQVVARDGDGYVAGSDPRRDGLVGTRA